MEESIAEESIARWTLNANCQLARGVSSEVRNQSPQLARDIKTGDVTRERPAGKLCCHGCVENRGWSSMLAGGLASRFA